MPEYTPQPKGTSSHLPYGSCRLHPHRLLQPLLLQCVKCEGPKRLHIPLRYKENKGGREVLLNCGLKILWSWEQLILFHVSSNPYPIFIMYWSQWSGIHWASPPIQTLRYQQNQDKGGKELESNPLKPAFLWCMHTALRPKQTNLTLRLIQSCIYEHKNPTSTSLQCNDAIWREN